MHYTNEIKKKIKYTNYQQYFYMYLDYKKIDTNLMLIR